MASLAPPVAAVRAAVRRALTGLPGAGPVLVACSGGADSLALAAATAFVAPRLGRRAGLVTVDHGLQPGSSRRAEAVADWARDQGLDPVEAVPVRVGGRTGGPEAAAREARYEALIDAARRHEVAAVLLGHTRDDQAETVLLALARGAGPRGLAAMQERRELAGVPLLRPLLDVAREDTRKACAALGLTPWDDPHNADPAYARSRVRADLLPALVDALGPGVVDNLARTARLLADDTAALDDLAAAALAAAPVPEPTSAGGPAPATPTAGGGDRPVAVRPVRAAEGGLAVEALAQLPAAVRTRVLHAWARELGASPAALSHRHVVALDALVTDWHGQGAVHLPGGLPVVRRAGRLVPSA